MNKKLWLAAFAITVLTTTAFAETLETDFRAELTNDFKGVIITGYHGRATEINIPDTIGGLPVLEIGNGAFAYTLITSVVVPEGVVRLGNPRTPGKYIGAFDSCPNLKSVTLPESLISMNSRTFYRCESLETITLPPNLRVIGPRAFAECTALTTIEFPASIGSIGASAFEGCLVLVNVNIPESVHRIRIINYLRPAFKTCPRLSASSRVYLRQRGYIGPF